MVHKNVMMGRPEHDEILAVWPGCPVRIAVAFPGWDVRGRWFGSRV